MFPVLRLTADCTDYFVVSRDQARPITDLGFPKYKFMTIIRRLDVISKQLETGKESKTQN